jgi:glutamine cyclotransferase
VKPLGTSFLRRPSAVAHLGRCAFWPLRRLAAAPFGRCALLTTTLALLSCSGEPVPFEVTARFPHDPSAYTQGLVWSNGTMYESTGRYGYSQIRRVDLNTGKIIEARSLPANRFGEGLALLNGRLYQLTWESNIAYVFDAATLALQDSIPYPGQGWGLATDGTSLFLSDGSDSIRVVSPEGFALQRVIKVRLQGSPLLKINELEFVNGEILANVYETNWVVRIDPSTGEVRETIDFTELFRDRGTAEVMNGIAIAPDSGQLLLTGKFWPTMFQVRLLPAVAR